MKKKKHNKTPNMIPSKIDLIEKTIIVLEKRSLEIEKRLSMVERRIDNISSQLERVRLQLEKLTNALIDFKNEKRKSLFKRLLEYIKRVGVVK